MCCLGVSEWLYEMVVDVWRFPPMYNLLFGGVRVAVRNGGGCVEVPPNARKSAKLRVMEISRVREGRKVDVQVPPRL